MKTIKEHVVYAEKPPWLWRAFEEISLQYDFMEFAFDQNNPFFKFVAPFLLMRRKTWKKTIFLKCFVMLKNSLYNMFYVFSCVFCVEHTIHIIMHNFLEVAVFQNNPSFVSACLFLKRRKIRMNCIFAYKTHFFF